MCVWSIQRCLSTTIWYLRLSFSFLISFLDMFHLSIFSSKVAQALWMPKLSGADGGLQSHQWRLQPVSPGVAGGAIVIRAALASPPQQLSLTRLGHPLTHRLSLSAAQRRLNARHKYQPNYYLFLDIPPSPSTIGIEAYSLLSVFCVCVVFSSLTFVFVYYLHHL